VYFTASQGLSLRIGIGEGVLEYFTLFKMVSFLGIFIFAVLVEDWEETDFFDEEDRL